MSSKKKATTPCKFNLAIDCDGSDCSRCGWCPAVKERRLKDRGIEIKEAEATHKLVEVYDETQQRTVGKIWWPVFIHKEDTYK